MPSPDIHPFLARWQASGAAERANYQLFLAELCQMLGVPGPEPTKPDDHENAYVFEKSVVFQHGDGTRTTKFIDLYKRGCFVLEAKQGVEKEQQEAALSRTVQTQRNQRKKGTATRETLAWADAMMSARNQAENYARALPSFEGRPPFLIIVDVGHSIELYAEFTRTGGTYVPFPDPRTHRILLPNLTNKEQRETLQAIWNDPLSLDPARRSAQVTQDIAQRLARLAVSLEASGHAPETVATFLMRCLFTMFAEDARLLPPQSFTSLLQSIRGKPEQFAHLAESLWQTMKTGGFSVVLRESLLQFNGGLFADATALALSHDQLELLIEAGKANWRDVEPAIFGTLLERALDPIEHSRLGAHYTPRAYVERLVLPTVVEPLREEWTAVQTAAVTLARQEKYREARREVELFHRRLCEVRILDPACGSGNFLYVTLEHLKRLEGEVIDTLQRLASEWLFEASTDNAQVTVDPRQFLGLEVNPRAAAIAELVLWIGYLQWHFRTRGQVNPPEPVIKNFHNIECRDAVLAWDSEEPMLDDQGRPVTRWDGRTMKKHPVTGENVPDESAQVPAMRYINPRIATWPDAEFVVGNPPFVGIARMRTVLGDGYAETIRATHPELPESCDYVMYWWNYAAQLVREGKVRHFGFITTNSLRQAFNRRILDAHLSDKNPMSLLFAIPDHPWVDSADGADVRIAMTVGEAGKHEGVINRVVSELTGEGLEIAVNFSQQKGIILPDLTIGANVAGAQVLTANAGIGNRGVQLIGTGFIVSDDRAKSLGLEVVEGLERHIVKYRNGRDIMAVSRNVMVIDLFGLEIDEVRKRFLAVYQWVLERVKPERDQNNRASYREKWWIFGEPVKTTRDAIADLRRYIVTCRTAKHRVFVFLDRDVIPDAKLITIALDDAYYLGVLSSRVHVAWAMASGGWLGVGNDSNYNHSECFNKFPFPYVTESQNSCIRELAESLDTHRKRQQKQHSSVTMTDMYNVLEKLRSGQPLTEKEKVTHEQGLVSVLRQIHDDLDVAVFDAYGWPASLTDEEILERLVALNTERVAEERRGIIRWLRPEYQKREEMTQTGTDFDDQTAVAAIDTKEKKPNWPTTLPEQARAVQAALVTLATPATPEDVAQYFMRARTDRVTELLETLVSLGQSFQLDDGRFVARLLRLS